MNYPKMIINYLKPELSVYAAEALEIVLDQIPNDETDTLGQVIRYAYNICFDEDELGDVLFDNDTSESFANHAYIPNVADELEQALYNMLYGGYMAISLKGEFSIEDFDDIPNFLDFDDDKHIFEIQFITDFREKALGELDKDWVKRESEVDYTFRLSGVYDLKADDWLKVNYIGDLHGAD